MVAATRDRDLSKRSHIVAAKIYQSLIAPTLGLFTTLAKTLTLGVVKKRTLASRTDHNMCVSPRLGSPLPLLHGIIFQ